MKRLRTQLRHMNIAGLTMIELLIVIVIIATLFMLLLLMIRGNIFRARDAQRKGDLEKMQVAFEEYYNDEGCYPPADLVEDCGGDALDPYLDRVPCDPTDGDPYLYIPNDDRCDGYRLYAQLTNTEDPEIEELACDGACGCGYGPDYNYGVAANNTVTTESCLADTLPSPSPDASGDGSGGESPNPSSSPSEPVYVYACDFNGECNQFEEGNPDLAGCTTFSTPEECDTNCTEELQCDTGSN